MKILVISQYFYPETFRVNTLCTELVRRGHQVTVLTGYPQYPQGKIYNGYGFYKPYDRVWNGVEIQRIRVFPRGRGAIGLILNCLSFIVEGERWVRQCERKFDIIYVFEVSPVTVGLPAVAYKEKFGAPLLFNVQDLWPESVEIVLGIHNRLLIWVLNKIVDKIYAASDKILCSSRGYVTNIATRGVSLEKLIFWPQFCAEPDLTERTKPEIYKAENFNIVFAGNIGNAQGLDLLLDAAMRLKNTNVQWFLVGDGRARSELEKKVEKYELSGNVHFVGKVSESEADRYVHYADCAYLSFMDNDLFNMVIPAKLQTYLACGTPVLVVANGESREIVAKHHCGVACNRDTASIVAAIQQIQQDHNRAQVMRKNARSCYEANFTVDHLVADLESIMHRAINSAK